MISMIDMPKATGVEYKRLHVHTKVLRTSQTDSLFIILVPLGHHDYSSEDARATATIRHRMRLERLSWDDLGV